MARELKQKMPAFALVTIMLASVFLLRILTARLSGLHLPDQAQDLLTLALSVIYEALPFVLLGIILSILVQIFVPPRFISRHLPKNPFLRRASVSLFGILLPVCECGNVPLARGLMVQGMSVSDTLTFLLAAPILNPITIAATWQAFRGDYTILFSRIIGGFVAANFVGWLFSRHPNEMELLNNDFRATCDAAHDHRPKKSWQSVSELFLRESRIIVPALLFGALLAGSVQTFVPHDILLRIGSDPVWSVMAMIALAFVISICANVDAFFALAFKSTFTIGAIGSFLVFGPMIDIKMLSLMRTTYKPRVLVTLTCVVFAISAILGLVVNYAF